MPIREVKIDLDSQWSILFQKRLNTNYSSAPFYEYYADKLFSIVDRGHVFLFDLNIDLLHWCIDILNIEVEMKLTETYNRSYPESWNDQRNKMKPQFKLESDIAQVRYEQVFAEKHGFIPNLSIVDMIFCCGPESRSILSHSS